MAHIIKFGTLSEHSDGKLQISGFHVNCEDMSKYSSEFVILYLIKQRIEQLLLNLSKVTIEHENS